MADICAHSTHTIHCCRWGWKLMWAYLYTLPMVLVDVAAMAFLFAIPVCLGVLLRLLTRTVPPHWVGWLGAALLVAVRYNAGDPLAEPPLVIVSAGGSFLATLGMAMFDRFLLLAVAFLFVNGGVTLVDRQINRPSGRFWLVVCPVIAATVYGSLVFELTALYLDSGRPGAFACLFFALYRFLGVELLGVLGATLLITSRCLNRSHQSRCVGDNTREI